MANANTTKPLGSVIEVPEGAQVTRPGERGAARGALTVHGGTYVLDVPGVHVVDGREITVG